MFYNASYISATFNMHAFCTVMLDYIRALILHVARYLDLPGCMHFSTVESTEQGGRDQERPCMYTISDIPPTPPRLSVLDLVLQLWRKIEAADKIRNRKPEFEVTL